MRARSPRPGGFSLIELVIVVVIIGIVGAIAIPRLSRAGESAAESALSACLQRGQKAIDLYTAEHAGLSPAQKPDASLDTDSRNFVKRLVRKTDDNGTGSLTGIYGPYLRDWFSNPVNQRQSLRIDGAAAGANTHGWRFDSGKMLLESDAVAGEAPGGADVDLKDIAKEVGEAKAIAPK